MQPEILILKDAGADPDLPLPAYETAGAASMNASTATQTMKITTRTRSTPQPIHQDRPRMLRKTMGSSAMA